MHFLLKPSSGSKGPSTIAALTVLVDGVAVWPVADAPDISMEVPIDDLLSHLVEFWEPLALRQTYPLPVAPMRPMELRMEAERRWDEQPAEIAEREDAVLSAFEEAHDLSRCFAGYFDLPPLWLLRRGERMIIDTSAGMRSVDFHVALTELTRVGNEIVERLTRQGDRWSALANLWERRESKDPLSMLAWATGLSRDVAEELTREGILQEPINFAEIANDNDELRIAARMAGALPVNEVRAILTMVAQFPKYQAPALDALAKEVSRYNADQYANRRAYEQGELAARYVRNKLNVGLNGIFDIEKELETLGVTLRFRSVDPVGLKALAIDGSRHGPVAFVNMKALGRSERSKRVDLAHEFCHLLLDRGHALGAIDVLKSRMPVEVEQRAKSFAGELLAPTEAVGRHWRQSGAPRSHNLLKRLTREIETAFDVPKAVAVWKLDHATKNDGVDVSYQLDQIAPER